MIDWISWFLKNPGYGIVTAFGIFLLQRVFDKYLKGPIDQALSHINSRWSAYSEKRRQAWESKISRLATDDRLMQHERHLELRNRGKTTIMLIFLAAFSVQTTGIQNTSIDFMRTLAFILVVILIIADSRRCITIDAAEQWRTWQAGQTNATAPEGQGTHPSDEPRLTEGKR